VLNEIEQHMEEENNRTWIDLDVNKSVKIGNGMSQYAICHNTVGFAERRVSFLQSKIEPERSNVTVLVCKSRFGGELRGGTK
jgi:hypothetical protein